MVSQNTQTESIDTIRSEIDRIDSAMFALIEERCRYVEQIGHIKAGRNQTAGDAEQRCFIRPGREGAMLQKIWNHFMSLPFTPAGAVSMWREVINASITMETPLSLMIAGDAHSPQFWQARDYFGHFIPVDTDVDAVDVVKAVEKDHTIVGILPYYESGNSGLFEALSLMKKSHIFAFLPFVEDKNYDGKAIAIARILPEASGTDITFYAVSDAKGEITRLEHCEGFYESADTLRAEHTVALKDGQQLRIIGHSTQPHALSEWGGL